MRAMEDVNIMDEVRELSRVNSAASAASQAPPSLPQLAATVALNQNDIATACKVDCRTKKLTFYKIKVKRKPWD